MSDSTLMRLVARGDVDAFDELYRRHGRGALLHARRLGAPRELAEDVVQEAFVSLWRRAGQYHAERGAVGTWLGTIVRNRLTDAWRRAGARPAEVAAELAPESVATTAGELAYGDRLALRAVVSSLPAEQRQAIVLSYFGGLTHEQIADTSGAPLGTVKGRLRLGLEKLRFQMAA
jgi:RNA polymerase sigma-70 factor (ECF subfamily)